MGVEGVTEVLMQYDLDTRVHMLALLQAHASGLPCLNSNYADAGYSVLDSGSSRHIHPHATMTDAEQSVALSGFDKSVRWTEGGGYLPVQWISRESGETVAADITEVDILAQVAHPILSMGKLIRKGFDFFMGDFGNDMYATAPGGAYTVKLDIGVDDVLRIPRHEQTDT